MTALLQVQNLHARYGQTPVLHGISLSVAAGQVTALLGANGAGKTTTLRALCQLGVQTTGSIMLDNLALQGRNTESIARLGVGHVPDGRGTFMALSTEDNLRLGAFSRPHRDGLAQDLAQVYDYFPRLKERASQQAGTLSGGEQQMLALRT